MGIIATKRYHGRFNYQEQILPGEIAVDEDKGIIILHLTQVYETDTDFATDSFAQRNYEEENRIRTVRIPHITGRLHSEQAISLFNCRRFYDMYDGNSYVRTLKFQADYMIFDDIQEETEPSYRRFVFVVDNALLWSDMSQVDAYRDPDTGSHKIQFKKVKPKQYLWGDTKIKFSTDLDYSDLVGSERIEKSKITERLKIQIIAKDSDKTVKEFLEKRDQILAMISFAISDNVNVAYQYFCTENGYTTYVTHTGKIERDYEQYKIVTNDKKKDFVRRAVDDYNFMLADLPTRKDLGLTLNKLKPVFNLYSSFFHYLDMPLEMIFLNVTQALETFHARFFYNNDKQNMVTYVKRKFGTLDASDPLRLQLLPAVYKSNILLSARFNDLFVRGENDLFAEFYKEKVDYGYRLAQTRNYYTHYPEAPDSTIMEGNELFDAIGILKWVLEYHVCTALGVKAIERKIRFKLYPELKQKEFQEIMAAYREKYGDDT